MRLPADRLVVYAPAWEGAAEYDAAQPFPVHRHPDLADAAQPTTVAATARSS